ncbi:hypothetical protein HHK36_031211 [Tetracentron sinense]|uniref:Uncharacterized protein n=1 Tax=Tetracentron sinense TaxID=13715 RepID=A0A834Y951_TETSI|nr:hypothetical protein HHK36_031211 [Tetracentron sinense]
MNWFYTERRGLEWKRGWTGQTLASISAPPWPLLAIFGIVLLFLMLSHYADYKAQMHNNIINFQLFFFLLPVLLIIIVSSMSIHRRYTFWLPLPEHDSIHRAGSSPWGVAVLVVVLLLMVSYQSSFQSQWFRPLRRSD